MHRGLLILMLISLPLMGEDRVLRDGWKLSLEVSWKQYKATVPSTVCGVLYDAGVLPKDVLEGVTYLDIDPAFFDETWIYKTTFKCKKARGRRYELVFDGIDYYADIFLNGTQIAASDTTAGVFLRRAYDVTDLLKGRNKLEVRLGRAQKGDLNIGFVDWNPRPHDESMGIVRPVTLRSFGDISIEDVFVIPSLAVPTCDKADLEVRIKLRNHSQTQQGATLMLDLKGVGKVKVPVRLAEGESRTVILTPAEAPVLHLENPRVWWTYDLGKPELYTLDVAVGESDSKEVTFGVRRIESRLTEDGHRQFTLNGRDILIRGGGWTDDIFLRDTPATLALQVEYVKDMHLNTIRFENIWGKDDTIYDLCDREGVLALVGWSCQWEWENYCGLPQMGKTGCINTPETEDLAVRYFRDQVVRLHNHPSVIGWLTGSDFAPNPRLGARYMEIYKAEDYRPYICSAARLTSEYGGPSGMTMAGPYEYVGPEYWYLDTRRGGAFGFNTETGIGANLPQIESLKRMIPEEEERWPVSSASWNFHCTAASEAMHSPEALLEAVNGTYGESRSLEEFVWKAHALDYNGTRAMFESFRVRRPVSTGIVQWMLNSAWPSVYWQLYDWYGVPTAAYYGTRKACEPLQLIYDYAERMVFAVNETASPAALKARIRVYSTKSTLLYDRTVDVNVFPEQPVPVEDLVAFEGKPFFLSLDLQDGDGKKVAENFYTIGAEDNTYDWGKSKWYVTPITKYTDLKFAVEEKSSLSGEIVFDGKVATVTVTNHSGVIAPMTVLKAYDLKGNLVVPAWWSDNFFPMLPGETRVVTCRNDGSAVRIEIYY